MSFFLFGAFLRLVGGVATSAALLICATLSAQAHPHVTVIAASALIYDADGALMAVRHEWTFDKEFSAYAIQDIKPTTSGVYTRDDLAALAQTNIESMKDFGYFSAVMTDGRKQKLAAPADYFLEYKNDALVLHFTLPLRAAVRAKETALTVVDASYFVAFTYRDADPVTLVGAPASCKASIKRPEGSDNLQKFSEEDFEKADVMKLGTTLATVVSVRCL